MGLFTGWFRKPVAPAPATAHLPSATRDQTRRELMTMAVRDTFRKHGMAVASISTEISSFRSHGGNHVLQLELVVTQSDAKLLASAVGLQKAIKARLLRLDPLADQWLRGIVWNFEAADDAQWPALSGGSLMAAPISASAAPRSRPMRASIEKILESRDAAFASRNAAATEFSPTLPMTAR